MLVGHCGFRSGRLGIHGNTLMKRKFSSAGTTFCRCICSKPERCELYKQRISNIPGVKCGWINLSSAPSNNIINARGNRASSCNNISWSVVGTVGGRYIIPYTSNPPYLNRNPNSDPQYPTTWSPDNLVYHLTKGSYTAVLKVHKPRRFSWTPCNPSTDLVVLFWFFTEPDQSRDITSSSI